MNSKRNKITTHPLFFPITISIIYFFLNLIIALNHEPWADTVNPYLLAKEFTFTNFPEILHGEPHPILWTLLLAPLAKLGLPIIDALLLSLAIMTAAVFLLARFSPFKKPTIIILTASAAFFYFLPVISRNYCLIPLALILTAMAYKSRLSHPIRYCLALTLLSQSHFLLLIPTATLFIIFVSVSTPVKQ
jgi:hypothetical protein